MKKVSVIGAGQVGATTALRILEKELANVVLVDIVEGIPQGKALDMNQAAPIEKHDNRITGTNNFEDIKDSDIVIITAGLPRKPGMTREDLLNTNAKIVKSVAENIKKHAPNSIVIVVTNPLDVMAYVTLKTTGFKPNKVMGMAGILDSTRFREFIAQELDISIRYISAMVLGGHGDEMVPIPEYTTVSGIPITELMDEETINKLAERTRNAGGEIVKHLKTGSAFYAPASSITEMVEAIIKDNKQILPVSVYLQGEYGHKDIYLGVPVKLGEKGVEEIIKLKLNDKIKKQLDKSVSIIKENISKLKI